MHLKDSFNEVAAVNNTSDAKHLYRRIDQEMQKPGHPPADIKTGHAALKALTKAYPDAAKQPQPADTPAKTVQPAINQRAPQQRSSGHKKADNGRARRTPTKQPTRRSSATRPTARKATRTVVRAAKTVDQATGSWAGDVWDWILGGIGLSLFLLVLTHPIGLDRLMTGGSNAIRWITDPTIDPLRPGPSTTKAKKKK